MKRKISLQYLIYVTAFCTAAAVCLTVLLFVCLTEKNNSGALSGYAAKVSEINKLIEEYYIYDTDYTMLADGIATGYVYGLNDKYSNYIAASDREANMDSFYGYNTGMGVQVVSHPDSGNMYVIHTHSGGPAENAGILPGDEIVEVDGNVVSEYGYKETLLYIRSKALETSIHILLDRGGDKIETDVVLTRYSSQSVFFELVGNKGFIRITEFNEMSVEQFRNALNELQAGGATSYIIDLRGNGGGTLISVRDMIDMIVPEGLIVKVEYKDNRNNEIYMSDSSEINLPIAILTDANTASAAELFSQSLKDYGKAVTVGSVTYGKGVVQKTFTLSDGSQVKFTVGKYYTANGTCLDKIGVIPDIETYWTEDEAAHRYVSGLRNDKDFVTACDYLDNLN